MRQLARVSDQALGQGLDREVPDERITVEIPTENILVTELEHLITGSPTGPLGDRASIISTPDQETPCAPTFTLEQQLEDCVGDDGHLHIPIARAVIGESSTSVGEIGGLTVVAEFAGP